MPMKMLKEIASSLEMVAACFHEEQAMLDVSLLVPNYVIVLSQLIALPVFLHYYR